MITRVMTIQNGERERGSDNKKQRKRKQKIKNRRMCYSESEMNENFTSFVL